MAEPQIRPGAAVDLWRRPATMWSICGEYCNKSTTTRTVGLRVGAFSSDHRRGLIGRTEVAWLTRMTGATG